MIVAWEPPTPAEQEIIERPDCVESYVFGVEHPRETSAIVVRPDGTKQRSVSFELSAGYPVQIPGADLSREQREEIAQILLVDLPFSPPAKRSGSCTFSPIYGLRFWRGAEFVDVRFSMECNEARVGSGGGPMDALTDRLRAMFRTLHLN